MYTVLNIAKTILALAVKNSIRLSPLQLIRIVYIIYVIYEVSRNKSLFKGNIKEWNFSLIFKEIFYAFIPFGANPVKASLNQKHNVSKDDLNFIQHIFEKHIVRNIDKLNKTNLNSIIEKIQKALKQ